MPDLPWTSRMEMDPEREFLVLASHLPLKSFWSTIRFFRAVSAIRKQLAPVDGLVGYTLRAQPLSRNYWTLSVWTDEAAMRAFVRATPHVELMSSLNPLMGPTQFVQWNITGGQGRPSWNAALERLSSS